MKFSTFHILAVATILAWDVAHAHALHVGDIWVGLAGNQVVTGQVNPDQTINASVRTFQSTFGDSGFDYFTTSPGFDAALIFDPNFRIGFNMLAPCQFWNGTEFGPTAGETIRMSFLTLLQTTGACFVPGFDLAVQPDGGWHRHFNMFLNPDGNGNRQLGIYLLKLELYYTKPGFQKSPAFWIVFNNQDTAANQNLAIDWVIQHLVNCPADVNRDNTVNVNDLLAVVNSWGACP